MITIQTTKNFKAIDFDQEKINIAVKAVCSRFNLPNATIDIAIVDDTEIKKLNKRFLSRSETTDCLSFNLTEQDDETTFELIVNGQMAVRQATLRGHSPQAELALYIVHSMLHNLGFDDSDNTQAEKMHKLEDEILTHTGFGPIYYQN